MVTEYTTNEYHCEREEGGRGRGGMEGDAERWRQKDDGAGKREGKGLKTQMEGWGLPTLPHRVLG